MSTKQEVLLEKCKKTIKEYFNVKTRVKDNSIKFNLKELTHENLNGFFVTTLYCKEFFIKRSGKGLVLTYNF